RWLRQPRPGVHSPGSGGCAEDGRDQAASHSGSLTPASTDGETCAEPCQGTRSVLSYVVPGSAKFASLIAYRACQRTCRSSSCVGGCLECVAHVRLPGQRAQPTCGFSPHLSGGVVFEPVQQCWQCARVVGRLVADYLNREPTGPGIAVGEVGELAIVVASGGA